MDTKEFKIRTLKIEDIPQILPVLERMYLDHDLAEPNLFHPDSFSPKQIENYLLKALENSKVKVFVAEVEDKIIGMIRAEVKIPPSFYKDKRIGYLDDLVVDENYRRSGVATKLTSKALEFLKTKGINLVETKVYEFNLPSQELNHSLGFKKTFSYFYKRLG